MGTLLRIENLARVYPSEAGELTVFRDLNLEIAEREQIAIVGESGAGKSTLLYLIAGLDLPSAGAVFYKGENVAAMDEAGRARYRNREIGFVWQQHRLLQDFTAEENVAMPLLIRGESRGSAFRAARASLESVGLGARASHRAGELSGGEQQRAAIARAVVTSPSLLIADEPTGNLDERTAERVFELLAEIARRFTIVLVTHNRRFADACGRVLRMEHGAITPAPR